MRACGFCGLAMALVLIAPGAWGQEKEGAATNRTASTTQPEIAFSPKVDSRPYQTFYLSTVVSQNDAYEVVTAMRNILSPDVKIYLVPSENAIVMRATPDQFVMAQKIINDLDRPKKVYRLTYTVSEMDEGKRIGVQHFSMTLVAGQRTTLKQGNKVPIATGSSEGSSGSEMKVQMTYLDVGMNFDATLDQYADGVRLHSKVEQSRVVEERSSAGPQDPILRQTVIEGTSFLTPGKPLMLGSLDVTGSTRHQDVEVVVEVVR
jgi:type II secretory pathway component GspD/PulD (secretin)